MDYLIKIFLDIVFGDIGVGDELKELPHCHCTHTILPEVLCIKDEMENMFKGKLVITLTLISTTMTTSLNIQSNQSFYGSFLH